MSSGSADGTRAGESVIEVRPIGLVGLRRGSHPAPTGGGSSSTICTKPPEGRVATKNALSNTRPRQLGKAGRTIGEQVLPIRSSRRPTITHRDAAGGWKRRLPTRSRQTSKHGANIDPGRSSPQLILQRTRRSAARRVVGRPGLEPGTYGLKVHGPDARSVSSVSDYADSSATSPFSMPRNADGLRAVPRRSSKHRAYTTPWEGSHAEW